MDMDMDKKLNEFNKKLDEVGKAVGIVAMIVAILSLIMPGGIVLATFIGIPLILCSRNEGLLFAYVAIGLNLINVLFLSPVLWLAYELGSNGIFFYILVHVASIYGIYKLGNK